MDYEVTALRIAYDGAIIRVRVDTVTMPGGSSADREVVEHDDSVAIVACDEDGRVLLMQQYRHPFTTTLTEIPAGLRDEPGETPLQTARRELREEVGLEARRWTPLITVKTSPGVSTESADIFLAEELSGVDRDPDASSEEAGISTRWTPLDDALEDVVAGRITDALAVAGLFAAARLRAGGRG